MRLNVQVTMGEGGMGDEVAVDIRRDRTNAGKLCRATAVHTTKKSAGLGAKGIS